MKYSPLHPVGRHLLAAAVTLGAACGLGNPAQAGAGAIDQRALVEIADPQRQGAAWEDEPVQVIETVVISVPSDPPNWFPALRADQVTLTPSPARPVSLQAAEPGDGGEPTLSEHAVIPLPPAAWTGLAGLSALATVGWRKSIARFFV